MRVAGCELRVEETVQKRLLKEDILYFGSISQEYFKHWIEKLVLRLLIKLYFFMLFPAFGTIQKHIGPVETGWFLHAFRFITMTF